MSTASFLEALGSENANGHLVKDELIRACGNVPPEASVQEAVAACSAPVRQLAAVLKQLDVRARDIRLWGVEWLSAAMEEPFLKRGHKLTSRDLWEVTWSATLICSVHTSFTC